MVGGWVGVGLMVGRGNEEESEDKVMGGGGRRRRRWAKAGSVLYRWALKRLS
jgi:hypothetical protein